MIEDQQKDKDWLKLVITAILIVIAALFYFNLKMCSHSTAF